MDPVRLAVLAYEPSSFGSALGVRDIRFPYCKPNYGWACMDHGILNTAFPRHSTQPLQGSLCPLVSPAAEASHITCVGWAPL